MDRSVGSPRTRSVVGVRGPGVSVFGLPAASKPKPPSNYNFVSKSLERPIVAHSPTLHLKHRTFRNFRGRG